MATKSKTVKIRTTWGNWDNAFFGAELKDEAQKIISSRARTPLELLQEIKKAGIPFGIEAPKYEDKIYTIDLTEENRRKVSKILYGGNTTQTLHLFESLTITKRRVQFHTDKGTL